jgi:hypothetical protein
MSNLIITLAKNKHIMFKKIKSLLQENRNLHQANASRLKELDWANVFHDSIKGEDWINKTSLNVGRWAGGYAFFYVLVRILKETKPERILELGLGESTKVISKFIEHCNPTATHTIIEHDENWKNTFEENFHLPEQCKIQVCPLVEKNVHGHLNKMYQNFEEVAKGYFDLILIDGPFGSPRFSRYELMTKVWSLDHENNFIILFDDTHRKGEQETLQELKEHMTAKGIKFHVATYEGVKKCTVICSDNFKFLTTL